MGGGEVSEIFLSLIKKIGIVLASFFITFDLYPKFYLFFPLNKKSFLFQQSTISTITIKKNILHKVLGKRIFKGGGRIKTKHISLIIPHSCRIYYVAKSGIIY